MQERELMDALLSDPNRQLACRDNIVYWGTEAIGEIREGRFCPLVMGPCDEEDAELLRDVVDWKLQQDRALRRLLHPTQRESSVS